MSTPELKLQCERVRDMLFIYFMVTCKIKACVSNTKVSEDSNINLCDTCINVNPDKSTRRQADMWQMEQIWISLNTEEASLFNLLTTDHVRVWTFTLIHTLNREIDMN